MVPVVAVVLVAEVELEVAEPGRQRGYPGDIGRMDTHCSSLDLA